MALDTHYQAPLGEGTLDADSNWGVEIVVVCTKADMMGKLEVERQFKEEQFDYVQQVLRVVCLKCAYPPVRKSYPTIYAG